MTQRQGTLIGYDMKIAVPRGEICYLKWKYGGWPIFITNQMMPVNIIMLDIMDFEVILGMDWLHQNHTLANC